MSLTIVTLHPSDEHESCVRADAFVPVNDRMVGEERVHQGGGLRRHVGNQVPLH